MDASDAEVVRSMLSTRDLAFLPNGVAGTLNGRRDTLFLKGARETPERLCRLVCDAIKAIGTDVLIIASTFGPLRNVDTSQLPPIPPPRVYRLTGESSIERIHGMDSVICMHAESELHREESIASACMSDLLAICSERALPPARGRDTGTGNDADTRYRHKEEQRTARARLRLETTERVLASIGHLNSFDVNRLKWMFDVEEEA